MFSFFRRQKLTDLEIIAKLEKRIGIKLKKVTELKWDSVGYQLNDSQQVISLRLCKCNLTKLPLEITQLTNLTELSLWENQLTALPASIENLANLDRLDLAENKLRVLPPPISSLTKLIEFSLSHNQLNELPSQIGNLTNLTFLDLRKNQFKKFPKVLLDSNLEIVWKDNSYEYGINVYGNPFEVPPVEIVKKGKQAIIEYFKALGETEIIEPASIVQTIIQPINITPVEIPQTIIQETRISNISKPLNEAKLILIGDGGAGKTSLMKLLRGETFNPQESQIHGINIQQLNFSFNNNEIKLNCWDFGGQQIMHATHQFFLSKRSLYVLVVDSRRESHVDYWLKHIQTFAENAPVIIVLNKIDENPHFDVLRRQLKQNYPNIKAFCRLSCATNEGIDDLKNTIQTVLPNIALLNTLFPQRWFEVKNAIAAQAIHKNFTSYDHYIDICQQYKIFEESEQHTLINFLHDLGLVIHFSDAWLRETNVINPQWLTEAIYTIINAPSLANHGKLLKNQLASLLNTQVYPSHKHDYLLELMKKFELCFSLDQQTFLLPDLFSAHEPDFDFDFQHAIHFILEYDFLPKSVFTRLIVRMHHSIKNNLYWRNGVVLFDQTYQTTAFIETNQQQLKLHLQGNKAREYLTVLQFVLNDIHQSFSHLKITHKIGLPDHPEITVSYEYLLKLIENKQIDYVPPELPNKSYKINELLGVFSIEKWSDDQIVQMLRSMNQILENIGLKQEELLSRGEEIFEIKPELMGVSVDLKALWRKFKRNN